MSRKVGPFFAWQAAALAVVFAAAAGGAFTLGRAGETGAGAGLGEGEQLAAVRLGNLVDSVSTSGVVAFASRETVAFGVQGQIASVLVSEGDTVAKGQALATIDDSTAANLAVALAKAETQLRAARKAADVAATRPNAIAVAEVDAAIARAELADAEEALAKAMAGPDALEIVSLRAEVVVREQALATAKAKLAQATLASPIGGIVENVGMKEGGRANDVSAVIEIVNPSVVEETVAFEIAGEVAAVFVRKGDVVTAGQALAVIDDATRAALEKAAVDAEARAREAKNALDNLLEATPDEIAKAEAAIAEAETALAGARIDLAAAGNNSVKSVADANEKATDAEAAYAAVFRRWLGIAATAEELRSAPAELLASWQVDLDALFSDQSPFGSGGAIRLPDDDPETAWSETTVYAWHRLYPGAIVGTCGDEAPFQTVCAEKEMNDAWKALRDARDALSSAEVAALRKAIAAKAGLDKAEDDLTSAREALAKLLAPDELEVSRLRADLVVAEHALKEANAQRAAATLTSPVAGVVARVAMEPGDQANKASALIEIADPEAGAKRKTVAFDFEGEIAEVFVEEGDAVSEGQALARIDDVTRADLEATATNAEVKLRDARSSLASHTEPDPLAVAKASAALNAARTKLADAEAALAEAKAGGDSLASRLLQAELTVAEQGLASARRDFEGVTLRSPIAGVVENVSMKPGDWTNQGDTPPKIEVVDTSEVKINGTLNEVDALAVSVGVSADVSLIALEGQTLKGEVISIGTANSGQSGSATFPITIRLSIPQGLKLREGLSATAKIVLAEYPNVLLTPTASITGSIVSPTARVLVDGVIEERAVELGPSDDFWVVALEGLKEGDMVVMPEPASSSQFGGAGFFFEE